MKLVLALALCALVSSTQADSWAPAKVAAFASPTGKMVVRVLPGSNLGAVYGFGGARKGEAARAIFYRLDAAANYVKVREVSLLNPIAPVFAAVADSGELVTLDNWHNMGIGDSVIVVYSPDGTVLRKYRLADVYTESEIAKFNRTTSSIWWRCEIQTGFETRTSSVEFADELGGNVEVNVKTGVVTRTQTSRKGC